MPIGNQILVTSLRCALPATTSVLPCFSEMRWIETRVPLDTIGG